MLTSRKQPGDLDKALFLLGQALATSRELGMRSLEQRVEVLKEQMATVPPKAPAYPDGLTPREVEVLRLVAAGKSNREIAERLFISLNTVANHISNIFNKTSSSNRAEATSYAYRHRLVE
jgi:DNA-binding NarL/FixJ family response regulator